MVFWTLLLSALFVMSILYVLWGPKKIWATLISYLVLAVITIIIIKTNFSGLYTLDLIAFIIPNMFVIPIHFFVVSIIKNYVVTDDKHMSKYFIAIYNRVLIGLWSVFFVLILGIGLAIMDGFLTSFDPENIWSISVTGVFAVIIFIGIISLGYKKKFSYILILGTNVRKVFVLSTTKSRVLVNKIIGLNELYPRGIYQEFNQIKYLYYINQDLDLSNSGFIPYDSELFNHLKDYAESYHMLEVAYNEYIEKKSSI
ncbi:hypothetical protein [Acholeplasma granularum]|uniref:hypothetical protein n=1 Tax=Acholeplasma granularum TaxID=264635 RepID=UPI0004AC9773|nr:hypothetical protein [Acholeplasma granularum]